jgi:ornithine cyclodeaminase/alanine dehydrogenase-like protein (mu-crystallin family)
LKNKLKVIEGVKQGFISHAQGEIENPEQVQMLFGVDENTIEGDCYIKTASSRSLPLGPHILAMRSDSPGKVELEPVILNRANVILTDEHMQCLHHGELGHAVRAGLISEVKG